MNATPVRLFLALLFAIVSAIVGDAAAQEPPAEVGPSADRTEDGLGIPLSENPSWMLVPAASAPPRAGDSIVLLARVPRDGRDLWGSLRLAVGPERTVQLPPGEMRLQEGVDLAAKLSGPRIALRTSEGRNVALQFPEGARLEFSEETDETLAWLQGGYPDDHLVDLLPIPAKREGGSPAASFRTALNAIRVELTVSGDVGAAQRKTEQVLLGASHASGFEDQLEVLAEAAALRAELLTRMGLLERAHEAATRVLVTGTRPAVPEHGRAVPAHPELLALARRAADARPLVALRAELAARLAAAANEQAAAAGAAPADADSSQSREALQEKIRTYLGDQQAATGDQRSAYVRKHFGAASPELDRIVRELVAQGDEKALHDIGRPAAPVLAGLVLEDLERERPPASRAAKISAALGVESFDPAAFQATDALILLWRVDPEGCGALISDHLDVGGLGWRLRLLEALDASRVLAESPTSNPYWNERQCLHPVWLDVLERLLATPETVRRATPFLATAAARDALDAELVATIRAVLGSGPAATVDPLLAQLDPSYRVPSARPVWETALAHPRAEVRALAVEALGEFGADEAVLALADDESAQVRRALAGALARDEAGTLRFSNNNHLQRSTVGVDPFDAGASASSALRRLLVDPDAATRSAAFDAWLGAPTTVRHALLATVLEHATPTQRARSIDRMGTGHEAPDAALLTALASDPSDAVVAAVDETLLGRNLYDDREMLDALRTRLSDARRPLGWRMKSGAEYAERVVQRMASYHGLPGVSALLQACVARGDLHWLELVGDPRHLISPHTDYDAFAALPGRQRELLVHWLLTSEQSNVRGSASDYLRAFAQGGDAALATIRAAARDPELPGTARLLALDVALDRRLDTDVELAREVLLALDWEGESGLAESDALFALDARGAAGIALLLELDEDDLPLAALTRLEADFEPSAPRARELRDRILARWRDSGEGLDHTVGFAIEALALDPPEDVDRDLLIAAARDPKLVDHAVPTMGRLRDPAYLPELERALLGEGAVAALPSNRRPAVQRAAVEALTSHLSPEAAAALRRGLAIGTLHTEVEEGLDRIRRYHEEQALWAGAGGPFERQDAARELVVMLRDESPEVRAEAARGLATLGAVEALPKLIPLLRDESEPVRAAVRESLDRLHARADEGDDVGDDPDDASDG